MSSCQLEEFLVFKEEENEYFWADSLYPLRSSFLKSPEKLLLSSGDWVLSQRTCSQIPFFPLPERSVSVSNLYFLSYSIFVFIFIFSITLLLSPFCISPQFTPILKILTCRYSFAGLVSKGPFFLMGPLSPAILPGQEWLGGRPKCYLGGGE